MLTQGCLSKTTTTASAAVADSEAAKVYTDPHTASLFEEIILLKKEIERREQLPVFRVQKIQHAEEGFLDWLLCCFSPDAEVICTLVSVSPRHHPLTFEVRASQGRTSKNIFRLNQLVIFDEKTGLLYDPVPSKESRLMKSATCGYCFHSKTVPQAI
jgi:hypothetical protein